MIAKPPFRIHSTLKNGENVIYGPAHSASSSMGPAIPAGVNSGSNSLANVLPDPATQRGPTVSNNLNTDSKFSKSDHLKGRKMHPMPVGHHNQA